MIKKFITVTGINNKVNIVDGDREVDQGKVVMIMIDRHLEPRVIFSILKREFPSIELLSTGLISILGTGNIILLSGTKEDQSIIDNHMLGIQIIVLVTLKECLYTSNITNDNLINAKYPLGKLPFITKIVSFIS
jgi:hypothetical protein